MSLIMSMDCLKSLSVQVHFVALEELLIFLVLDHISQRDMSGDARRDDGRITWSLRHPAEVPYLGPCSITVLVVATAIVATAVVHI